MTSTICAIVPTYNRSRLLRECLDSLLSQTRQPDRILVINDGSTDDTEIVVQSYGNAVSLINKPNGGKSAALNLGIENCSEDYVWICDDDDIAAPTGLEKLATALDTHLEAGFAFGTFLIFPDKTPPTEGYPLDYVFRREETDLGVIFFEQMITCQFATLVRRSLYGKVGPFRQDLIRSQDYEMAIRLVHAAPAIQLSDVIFYQRSHTGIRGSASDSFSVEQSARKWLSYDQKIFAEIRQRHALTDFTPAFARAWDPQHTRRAALIERGCVTAGRALWPAAIEDFIEASKLTDPLSSQERTVAESVIRSDLAWQLLAQDASSMMELHRLFVGQGNALVIAICRPLGWHLRQKLIARKWPEAWIYLQLLTGILGSRGILARVIHSLRTRRNEIFKS